MSDQDEVERVARAICASKGLNPDTLYQHNFEGEYPKDERREYSDPFTGEPRVQLFHRAWRHSEKAALAALAAMKPACPEGSAEEMREKLAKIIDGRVWIWDDNSANAENQRKKALAKVDAIMAFQSALREGAPQAGHTDAEGSCRG